MTTKHQEIPESKLRLMETEQAVKAQHRLHYEEAKRLATCLMAVVRVYVPLDSSPHTGLHTAMTAALMAQLFGDNRPIDIVREELAKATNQ